MESFPETRARVNTSDVARYRTFCVKPSNLRNVCSKNELKAMKQSHAFSINLDETLRSLLGVHSIPMRVVVYSR